jgi:hypothetical protein
MKWTSTPSAVISGSAARSTTSRPRIVSGDTSIACANVRRRSARTASGGNVTLKLPETAGFTAKLDSVSGGLSCAFPGTLSGQDGCSWDGSASYRFNTVSGRSASNRTNGFTFSVCTPAVFRRRFLYKNSIFDAAYPLCRFARKSGA